MHVHVNGVQHIGITVRNLQHYLQFFKDTFGIEPQFILDAKGPEVSKMMDVPETDMTLAFLQLGNTHIELIEYKHPHGKDFALHNSDVGAMHVCFEVSDIHTAKKQLEEKGIKFNADPIAVSGGPLDGYSFVYFKGPDGLTFELFEVPAQSGA